MNILKNSPASEIDPWEKHLIERAKGGDQEALSHITESYRPLLRVTALSLLRNSEDANDAVQESIFKILRSLDDFDSGRQLRPWVTRICTNCCIDKARQRKKDASRLDKEPEIPDPSPQLDDVVGAKIRQKQLLEAVSRLPNQYRTIILMRHFRDMEVSEIASELKKPEGTIKSWLFRARALLKKDLRLAY